MGTITQCIATRFEQEDYEIYVNINWRRSYWNLLWVCDVTLTFGFFQVKRKTFAFTKHSRVNGVWHSRIWRQWFGNLHVVPPVSRRKLLGEISTLGKLLLVMPATNAVGERSFSALRRGKTYLSSTTGDSRLNHHMMLHVHKDETDVPTLVDVANDFVGKKENRKQLFEKLSANDIKSRQTEN